MTDAEHVKAEADVGCDGCKLGSDLRLEALDFRLAFGDFGTDDGASDNGLGGEELFKDPHSFSSFCQVLNAATALRQS